MSKGETCTRHKKYQCPLCPSQTAVDTGTMFYSIPKKKGSKAEKPKRPKK